jgi:hypothetical protein
MDNKPEQQDESIVGRDTPEREAEARHDTQLFEQDRVGPGDLEVEFESEIPEDED